MATVSITGTIQDATGSGVDDVVVRLAPSPENVGSAEAQAGFGMVSDPVEVLTDSTGAFTVNAVQGFRYNLSIAAIGYDRDFVAPAQSTITFTLLGLVPDIETVTQSVDGSGVRKTHILVACESVQTVRQRYDQFIIETSTELDGTYTTLATIPLHSQRKFYDLIHTAAPASSHYRSFYKNSSTNAVSLYSEIRSTEDEPTESLLISVEELKEVYLFGTDLTKDDGEAFPIRLFEHYIKAASEWLTKELDVKLVAHDYVNEVHDHFAYDYGRWGYFQLWHYPVVKISKVAFQYPSMDEEVVINNNWIILQEGGASGVVQIVPGQGNIADVLLIPGSLMPLWSGRSGRVPGIWHFDYRAGFEADSVPADIKHLIGMWSSIGVLNIAGDLIAGAGVATKTISVPGLHQNVVTTASSTNSGYGARILQYTKEIKQMLPNIRRYYGKNNRMVVA